MPETYIDKKYFHGEEGVYYSVKYDYFVRLTNRSFLNLWNEKTKNIRRVYQYDLETPKVNHKKVAMNLPKPDTFMWMGEP